MSKTKVFVVENDFVLSETLVTLLTRWGYELSGTAVNATEAIAMIAASQAQIVLLDIHLDDGQNGIKVGDYIRSHLCIPFIFMSGTNDPDIKEAAKALHPAAYLQKPFSWESLSTALCSVCDKANGDN